MTAQLTIAREIAYDAFVEVMENKADPDEVTERLVNECRYPIKRIDRNFIKEILFGGLRWYAKIHWIIQNTSKKDLAKSTPQIRAALILGAYQIFYMDRVPDRAAVNESVEYVRKKGQAGAVGFVNGILRAIARRAEYFSKPDKEKKPCEFLALQYAHPRWLVDRWHRRFSFDRLKEMLSSNNQPPPYTIRINTMRVAKDETQEFRATMLKEDKNQSERKALRSCLELKNSPNFEPGSLFQQGYYTVQDEASQLIGVLVAPQEGETVVDACAGPGGKLTHIYELAEGKINLIGIEKNAAQIQKTADNVQRLGHEKIVLIQQDFLDFKPEKPVDRILIDAPCSGLGVLRRHPDGKWHKNIADIPAMAKVQKELILHGLSILKEGGELIFSVCSFEPEETLDHITWLQKEHGDKIELISPVGRLPSYYKRFVTRENVLLIFSGNKDAMDGFGAFILKKKNL